LSSFDGRIAGERTAEVHFDHLAEPLKAHLYDLPCVIESHKTFDRKLFFKVTDICQMLVVSEPTPPDAPPELDPERRMAQRDNKWPSGLTPPLKYVRMRRFRKRSTKKVSASLPGCH
jgi:transcription initiation factor TFIID subunit 7